MHDPAGIRKDAAMPDKDADVQKIKELIQIMKENDLVKIDIQHGDDRISLQRAEPPQPVAAGHFLTALPGAMAPGALPQGTAVPAGQKGAAEGTVEIKSPMVGTFYEAPSPDSDPYVEPGAHVDTQTVVCIIEAMKVMNEIRAEISGTVVEKLVKNGQAVEYGQPLFRVKPE
jgi:acetyl-CoA carboxylase biotin carboxyl carrier protein